MRRWRPGVVFGAGLGVILLSNAVALLGVASNRFGEPTAELTLSDRELTIPYWFGQHHENSGVSVRLQWQRPPDGEWSWLNEEKLTELGFDVEGIKRRFEAFPQRRKRPLPRDVLVVFEYEGKAYRNAIAELEQKLSALRVQQREEEQSSATAEAGEDAERRRVAREVKRLQLSQQLEGLRTTASRLYAIDAGTDYESLRRRYPGSNIVVIPAQVRLRFEDRQGQWQVSGYISRINRPAIHVPQPFSELLRQSVRRPRDAEGVTPRFFITVKWGARLEPWIVDVREGQ